MVITDEFEGGMYLSFEGEMTVTNGQLFQKKYGIGIKEKIETLNYILDGLYDSGNVKSILATTENFVQNDVFLNYYILILLFKGIVRGLRDFFLVTPPSGIALCYANLGEKE